MITVPRFDFFVKIKTQAVLHPAAHLRHGELAGGNLPQSQFPCNGPSRWIPPKVGDEQLVGQPKSEQNRNDRQGREERQSAGTFSGEENAKEKIEKAGGVAEIIAA